MTPALAWFFGSVLMLAGLASAWVARRINSRNRESLRDRTCVQGEVTRVAAQTGVDDIGLRSSTVEYTVDGHRYRISAELGHDLCQVGLQVDVMMLPSMPSDALLRHDLRPVSFRKPMIAFLSGVALVAWNGFERGL